MRTHLVAGPLSLLFIIGCASTATYFIAPEFTGERLTSGGIAVLPVLVGQTGKCVFGTESYCRFVGEKLASGLRRKQPTLRVIGPTVVSHIFDKGDLVGDYSELIQHYQMVGMLSATISRKLSDHLSVEYFMLSRIHDLYPVGNDANASLSIQIWSAEEAEMVFEFNAQYRATGSHAPPYHLAITRTVHKIVDSATLILWGETPMYSYQSAYAGETGNAIAQEGS
jgi:hypothetical protein